MGDSILITQDIGQLLIKRLGKKYATRVEVEAVQMTEPFQVKDGGEEREAGDYLYCDFSGILKAHSKEWFEETYSPTRNRKPNIAKTDPPGVE